MTFATSIEFQPSIAVLDNTIASNDIVSLLQEVRGDLGRFDSNAESYTLPQVLAIVEKGTYTIPGGTHDIMMDLSAASRIIKTYRERSEGGCSSCQYLRDQTIDAQDASRGWYCGVADSTYVPHKGVTVAGFSPKVTEHYKTPCTDWKPRDSPTIEKLLNVGG